MPSFISSFSTADWLDIIGILMVAIGVVGELVLTSDFAKAFLKFPYNPSNFPPLDFRKKLLEIIFAGLVAVGLVFEVWALPAHF